MSKGGQIRRKWSQKGSFQPPLLEENKPKVNEVTEAHEEYLILLAERNRQLKLIEAQKRDSKQEELEQKERGFSLYFHGANTKHHRKKTHRSKVPKTAAPKVYSGGTPDKSVRSKTAPEKQRRKNWAAGSVHLKTARGEKLSVKAPEILTGNYADDFEDVSESYAGVGDIHRNSVGGNYSDSFEESSTDGDNDASSVSEEDIREVDESYARGEPIILGQKMAAKNQVTLSIADVKKLRQSLQQNESIRRSMAIGHQEMEVEDVEIEDNIHEEDEEEDIEEDIQSSGSAGAMMNPSDLIVLKFADNNRLDSPGRRVGRPLSASRRTKKDQERPDSSHQARAVAEAMRAENSRLSDLKRDTHSAPGRSQNDGSPLPHRDDRTSARPSSTSSRKSTSATKLYPAQDPRVSVSGVRQSGVAQSCAEILGEDPEDINSIVKRVLQLDARGQKDLMMMLANIEKASSPRKQKTQRRASDEQMDTEEIEDVEIKIWLVSNWGHSNRIGLTEVQILDTRGRRVDVDPANVSLNGAHNSTDVSCLFNGKCKTTKERNMWSCEFRKKPVSISIHLTTSCVNLAQIKVWNYNKALSDLNKGAREIEVVVNGEAVFTGELDKGCGNQVFDYGKIIALNDGANSAQNFHQMDTLDAPGKSIAAVHRLSPQLVGMMDNVSLHSDCDSTPNQSVNYEEVQNQSASPETEMDPIPEVRPGTRLINRTTDPNIELPVIGSTTSEKLQQHKGAAHKHKDRIKIPTKKESKDFQKSPQKTEAPSLPETRKPKRESDVTSSSSSKDFVSETKSKSKKSKPKTPRMAANLNGNRTPRSPDEEDSDRRGRPSWLDVGEQGSQDDEKTPVRDSGILLPSDLEERPRSGSSTQRKNGERLSARRRRDQFSVDGEELRLDLEADEDAGDGANDGVEDSGRSLSKMQRIESARAAWRLKEQSKLEESWVSLDMFERHQRGRLSVDLQDDVLDEYLNTERNKPAPINEQDMIIEDEEEFTIPELPEGREIVFSITSTWGDKHYVGLNGIEIFSSTGESVSVQKIRADPLDINVLDQYDKDPRVVTNLIDGIYRTRDDTHMWLAPYTKGKNHYIYITLAKTVNIAMIRIWNYNKSRIHSYRGARDVEIVIDNQSVFRGEIERACGGVMGGSEAYGDTILFTTDEDILEKVASHDSQFEVDMLAELDEEEDMERPPTADGSGGASQLRPFTSAAVRGGGTQQHHQQQQQQTKTVQDSPQEFWTAKSIVLNFLTTWGDPYYLGLTGLELVGREGESIDVTMEMVNADPQDLHVLPGYETDDRTLDKLLDGTNLTTMDEHMWLIPFTEGECHWLKIDFNQPVELTGMRVWNYNKSPEDTYRGAKTVEVLVDGQTVSPEGGFLIRKGPGNCYFDFAQEISFLGAHAPVTSPTGNMPQSHQSLILDEASQEYEALQMPSGFIYQFHLLSTWGDQYYTGLNGVEFYDSDGNNIQLTDNNISAYPHSVNVLEGVQDDIRTPDKLVDGVNDTTDGSHMWLAPVLPNMLNRVYVIFDSPKEISMIKLWNYSKTPNRGVKDFALLVDDLLIYNGTLNIVPASRGIIPTVTGSQHYHTILFTSNKSIIQREKHTAIANQPVEEQDVQLTNDKKVMSKYSNPRSATLGKPVNQALRPTTSVPTKRRGTKR